jgi:LCP family protein required for cell wall assembly
MVVLLGVAAGGAGFFYSQTLGSLHRIPVVALAAKNQPALPAATHGSMNVLLTASGLFPRQNMHTGFVELLHLNANRQGGAVISFPANTVVSVPGRGQVQIGSVAAIGGPSLLIETMEHLTGVRIDHYSRVTYSGLSQVVASMGGVNVDVPYSTTSLGWHFHAGINHLRGGTGSNTDALAYVRQPAVSEVGRMQLQENLFRAILHKIANRGFFDHTNWNVIHTVVNAVTVDSNFSNSQLVHLALGLRHLQGRDGVSIDVPTTGSPRTGDKQPVFLIHKLSKKLWRAIRHDSVMQFAHRYPFTVTPNSPG